MAIREIIRMGHPTLRQVARPVSPEELNSDFIGELIQDMVETLLDAGGIGLAAPQVDVPIRLAIIDLPGGPSRYGLLPRIPLTVFINPVITMLDDAAEGYWEGCLSVPGLRGFVERPQHIRVDAINEQGQPMALELKGFPATVFQHEFDHLDGRLYVDRITDMSRLVFEDLLELHPDFEVTSSEAD